MSADQWNAVVDKLAATIDAQDYGAVGDGSTDDTTALNAAIQAAQTAGKPLRLGVAHRISSALSVTGALEVVGQDTLLSTTAKTAAMFDLNAGSLKISRVRASGELKFVNIPSGVTFGTLELDRCTFAGKYDTTGTYYIYGADNGTVTGTNIKITNCTLSYCTAAYLDRVLLTDLVITDNTMTHMVRFVVRALDGTDPADPDNARVPERVIYRRNRVLGINDDFPSKSGVTARWIQANARKELIVEDNEVRDVLPTGATASGIYWEYGSLTYCRNKAVNIHSDGTTGERFISDKGETAYASRYQHKIQGNTWDQTGVTSAATGLSAICHFYSACNVTAGGNTFIGLRCPAYRIWQSVDIGTVPQNYAIGSGDQVINHYYPDVVEIVQQAKNVVVSGITVHQISNPESLSPQGGDATRMRVVTVYMSFSNGLHIENVVIRGNTLLGGDANTAIANIYRNASATTSEIKDWKVVGNSVKVDAPIVRFQGSAVGAGRIIGNDGSSTVTLGTVPAGTVSSGNT